MKPIVLKVVGEDSRRPQFSAQAQRRASNQFNWYAKHPRIASRRSASFDKEP